VLAQTEVGGEVKRRKLVKRDVGCRREVRWWRGEKWWREVMLERGGRMERRALERGGRLAEKCARGEGSRWRAVLAERGGGQGRVEQREFLK
jgi:hypothetical protein